MLDLVINHGIVIDVSAKQKRNLHIGISNGKIEELSTEPLKGKKVIQAEGLIVSPGFIDVHGHLDGDLYGGELSASQGITTTIGGNCGFSPKCLRTFFQEQDSRGYPIHQAMLAGHDHPIREKAGLSHTYEMAEDGQIEEMKRLVAVMLDEGACGVSFGLDYVPGVRIEEVTALAQVAKAYDRICAVHSRLLTPQDLYSIYELLQVARETKVSLLISHFVYQYCAGLTTDGLRMVEKAIQEGLQVHIDSGMYTNWSTGLNTATFDYKNIKNSNWEWSQMVVASGPHRGKTMTEELYFYMQQFDPNESIVFFEGTEEEVYECLAKPYAMPSTDAGAYAVGEGHPQIAGTYPRYIRKMVLEQKLLSLEEAIYKATLFPAQLFGFKNKGAIEVGMDADLTIIDLDKIEDKAQYPHLGRPDAKPEGIPYVIVGGELVIDQGTYTGSLSGRTIRKQG